MAVVNQLSDGCGEPGTKKVYTCECGKVYPHHATLWNHKRYNCGKAPEFICMFCDHVTHRKGNFKRHMLLRHPDQLSSTF
ncbi:hypothetical protein J6590_002326 [Homalodisca vitripennis]|nr:hypothetical protein J6590_002326 [Homalodisca vitripennis]